MATEQHYALALEPASLAQAARRRQGSEHVQLRLPRSSEGAELYDVYLDAFSTRTKTPLEKEVWVSKWFAHWQCELELSVVATVDDPLSGYLLAYWDAARPTEGFIGQLGVRTGVRRRGVAAAMVAASLLEFAKRGLSTAVLCVAPDNIGAIRLYEKLGFGRVRDA